MTVSNEVPVCSTCGSSSVKRDAWAVWDTEAQGWELHSSYDNCYCEDCDGECNLKWEPLTEED